jgi:hypothetical protein
MVQTLLVGGLVLAISASLYLEARQPSRQPFQVVVEQSSPPVTLFVHTPTGRCFLAYKAGGLLAVERTFCESLPPITPPVGPPISPER